jgi:tetratricopeptide (TPR) repeat protein
MGVVARASGPDGRTVALKLVQLRGVDDRRRRRFQREAQALARMDHPHITRYLDHGFQEQLGWLAMEIVEGPTLAELLTREGPFPVLRTMELARGIALALAHAHELGLIHRDVKPSNVMVDASGRVRLTDFGLVRDVEIEHSRLTRTGAMIGTPEYMAPELALGKLDQQGPAADVYGLGATLFDLLCGRPPFQAENLLELATKISSSRPPRPTSLRPDLPPAVDELILSSLAKAPEDRPSALEVSEICARLLEGQRVAPRRTGLLLAAALAGGVLAGGALVVGLMGGFRSGTPAPAEAPSPVSSTEASGGENEELRAAEAVAHEAPDALAHRQALRALENVLTEALEAAPESAELSLRRGEVRARLGDYAQACEDLWAARSASEGELAARATVTYALTRLKLAPAETRELAEKLGPPPALSAPAPLWQGLTAEVRRSLDPQLSEGALERLRALKGSEEPLWLNRVALALLAAGKGEAALRQVRRGLTLDPHDPDLLVSLARLLPQARGDSAEALAAASRALSVDPNLGRGRVARGVLNLRAWNYAQAASDLDLAARWGSRSRLWLLLAEAYERGGEEGKAFAALQEGQRRLRNDVALPAFEAYLRMRRGDGLGEVLTPMVLASARTRDPASQRVLSDGVMLVAGVAAPRGVKEVLIKLLDRDRPGSVLAARLDQRRREDFRPRAEALLAKDPKEWSRRYYLLQALRAKHKTRFAEALRRFLSDARDAKHAWALAVGGALMADFDPARAASIAQEALRLDPMCEAAWRLEASAARSRGDEAARRRALRRAGRGEPALAMFASMRAHYQHAMGRNKAAVEMFRDAMEYGWADAYGGEDLTYHFWLMRQRGEFTLITHELQRDGRLNTPTLVRYRALAFSSNDQQGDARQLLARTQAPPPGRWLDHLILAELYGQLGEPALAKTHLTTAERSNQVDPMFKAVRRALGLRQPRRR